MEDIKIDYTIRGDYFEAERIEYDNEQFEHTIERSDDNYLGDEHYE